MTKSLPTYENVHHAEEGGAQGKAAVEHDGKSWALLPAGQCKVCDRGGPH